MWGLDNPVSVFNIYESGDDTDTELQESKETATGGGEKLLNHSDDTFGKPGQLRDESPNSRHKHDQGG